MFTKWPQFVENFEKNFRRRIKDRNFISEFNELKNISTEKKNLIDYKIIKLLHAAITPTSRIKNKETGNILKTTINDSINSMVIQINTQSELQPKIEEIKNKFRSLDLTFQPSLLIIGELEQICVIYDEIYYKTDSILSALDICFKLFFVLNLKYSPQSAQVWQFIQKYFFEISVDGEKCFTQISSLISDLST